MSRAINGVVARACLKGDLDGIMSLVNKGLYKDIHVPLYMAITQNNLETVSKLQLRLTKEDFVSTKEARIYRWVNGGFDINSPPGRWTINNVNITYAPLEHAKTVKSKEIQIYLEDLMRTLYTKEELHTSYEFEKHVNELENIRDQFPGFLNWWLNYKIDILRLDRCIADKYPLLVEKYKSMKIDNIDNIDNVEMEKKFEEVEIAYCQFQELQQTKKYKNYISMKQVPGMNKFLVSRGLVVSVPGSTNDDEPTIRHLDECNAYIP